MLRTQIRSQGYTAPELLGLIPRRSNRATYCNGVDIWALGCVVHELLTTEIPFLEVGCIDTMMTGPDTEWEGDQLPEPDMFALKAFCGYTTEFLTDTLRKSGASEAAIEFVKSLMVPNPTSRAAAKEALQSPWLLQGDDPVNPRVELPVLARVVLHPISEPLDWGQPSQELRQMGDSVRQEARWPVEPPVVSSTRHRRPLVPGSTGSPSEQ